jgi:hypothetical protein
LNRGDVAKAFKVNEKAAQEAKALLAEAPDLAAEVESRTLNITNAYDGGAARGQARAQG